MGDPVKRLHGVAKLTCSHSTLIVAIQQAKTEFLDAEKFAQLSIIVLEVRLKGLPTLRLEAWASWRGPSGVVCLVVTPDGVDGPTI